MKDLLNEIFSPNEPLGLILISIVAGLVVTFIAWLFRVLFQREKGENNQVVSGNGNIQISKSKNIRVEGNIHER